MMRIIWFILFFCGIFQVQAQIIVGDSVSASVQYANFQDIELYRAPGSFSGDTSAYFDIDQDGSYDVHFEFSYVVSAGATQFLDQVLSAQANVEFVFPPGNAQVLDTLRGGQMLDRYYNWHSGNGNYLYFYVYYGGNYNIAGRFDTANRFLGFRINRISDTLYGWFEVELHDHGYALKTPILKSYGVSRSQVGINEWKFNNNNVKVFPNPASNKVYVKMSNGAKATLLNFMGEAIDALTDNEFDLSSLSNGIYYVQIKSPEGIACKKLIIQH